MNKIGLACAVLSIIALCAACSNTAAVDKSNLNTSAAESVTADSAETNSNTPENVEESSSDLAEEMSNTPDIATSDKAASTVPTESTDSTSTKKEAVPATDGQESAVYHYVNSRYGYSIAYPATWTAGEEADNGDGKILYVGNPDIDIRVYASNYMEDVSDPYHNDDNHVQRQRVAFNNGKEGTLVIGKEDNKILYDMVYVSKDDVEYHFYANVPQSFFDQNEKVLLKVAKSLDIPNE